MFLGLGQGLYWLTDGFELYAVAGLMAAAAVAVWLFGRAVITDRPVDC